MTEASRPALKSFMGRARSVRANLIVNISGQVWGLGLSLAVVPVYLRLLGIESYGLIGFFATLQAVIRVFDFGVSPTVVRQIARLSAGNRHREARDFFRTFEVVSALFAGTAGLTIALSAPLIAHFWLRSVALAPGTVVHAVTCMGLLCGTAWLSMFYQNTLFGLEHHMSVVSLRVGEATLSTGGGWLLVSLVSPSIVLLLAWQLAVGAVFCCLGGLLARHAFADAEGRAAFRATLLRQTWRIAAGMAGITVTGLILNSLDDVFVSRMLSLAEFGDYSLANMGATAVVASLAAASLNVMFPRFSALVALKDDAGLLDLYHACVQFLGVMVIPPATILVLYSHPLLVIWTGRPTIADAVSAPLAVIACSLAVNALMVPTFALQLAHAWTKVVIRMNVVLIGVLVVALLILTAKFGPLGAAEALLVMNATYLLIGLPITFHFLLPGQLAATWLRDILPGVATCVAIGLVLAFVGLTDHGKLLGLLQIGGAWVALTLCAAAACSRVRTLIWQWFRT